MKEIKGMAITANIDDWQNKDKIYLWQTHDQFLNDVFLTPFQSPATK